MPNRNNRRRNTYPDWESSETDETSTNSHNHSIADEAEAGEACEHGESNGNGYTNNNAGGARSNQGKASNASQPKHKVTLGPWTLVVSEALQSFEETQRKIDILQKVFMLHSNELKSVDETSRSLHQLEEYCKQKDEEIERHEMTIRTLMKMEAKAKAELQQESANIEKERNELKQEREKHDKRVAVVAAEEKLKVSQAIEKLMAQHEESHKKRKKELEDEAAQKRDENNGRAAAFEAERESLLTTVKEQELQIKAQAHKLKEHEEKYDLLERAKNSFRSDMEDREAKLEALKKEFALDPRPMDTLYVFYTPLPNGRDLVLKEI